jgi:hypothetical protein
MKSQVKIFVIIIESVYIYFNETKGRNHFIFVETILREGTYTREQILDALSSRKYEDIMAFYLLLGLRNIEVNINLSY